MKGWKHGCVCTIIIMMMISFGASGILLAAEEFTNTDTKRGLLTIHCNTFKGFHGTVEVSVRNESSGLEQDYILLEEGGYALNLSLAEANYQILDVSAKTDGRLYDCEVEKSELIVIANKIELCEINVLPDSLIRFPEIETWSDYNQTKNHEVEQPKENGNHELKSDIATQSDESAGNRVFVSAGIIGIIVCVGSIICIIRQKGG